MLYSILLHSLNTLLTWIDIFSQVFIALFFYLQGWHRDDIDLCRFKSKKIDRGFHEILEHYADARRAAHRRIRIWRHWPFCPRLVWWFWMFILFQIGDNWQVCPAALTFVTRICVICHMTLLFTRPKAFFLFVWILWKVMMLAINYMVSFSNFQEIWLYSNFFYSRKNTGWISLYFQFFFGKVHCVNCAWLFSI